jgi:NADPH:quinone reductase-like Zn-dependent oxidoreductase
MKALVRDRYGPPDVLDIRDVDQPTPADDEVLVRVQAASINDWDWALLRERPPFPISLMVPWVPILGSDIAGCVVAIGKQVVKFRPGEAVYGDLSRFRSGGFGGFAQYVSASERALALKPEGMTFVQAAALPQAGQLAVQGLAAGGPLRPGQKILINGAGGGVGTIAIQLAKLQDVEVTGVDSAPKLDMMRRLGFDHVIDYRKEDFTKNGRSYDLILDTKTNRSPLDYLRSLSPHGTYATVGASGPRLLQLTAFGWLIRPTTRKSVRVIILKQNLDLAYLSELFEAGQLAPVVDGPYSLADAREAFRHFGAGNHKGKIVLTVD